MEAYFVPSTYAYWTLILLESVLRETDIEEKKKLLEELIGISELLAAHQEKMEFVESASDSKKMADPNVEKIQFNIAIGLCLYARLVSHEQKDEIYQKVDTMRLKWF